MERKKEGVKPIWKKVTRGTLYPFANNRSKKVTQNGTIEATEEEIEKFKEHFELVKPGSGAYKSKAHLFGAKPKAKAVTSTEDPNKPKPFKSKNTKLKDLKGKHLSIVSSSEKELYEVHPAPEEGFFNVVSPAGKVMNEEGLTKEEADDLKYSLEITTTEDE